MILHYLEEKNDASPTSNFILKGKGDPKHINPVKEVEKSF